MPLSRRQFLKGMGVAVGGLGVSSAGYQHLVPFLRQPGDSDPGTSTWYATACRECPAGCGLVVRNLQGRAVKCEGNPLHPINRGALCARGQAALQGLYDPDRISGALRWGREGQHFGIEWTKAMDAVADVLRERPRIAILSDLQTGSLSTLFAHWMALFGGGRLVQYEPIDYEHVRAASGAVPRFDLSRAGCVISFGADFLETWISPVEFARQFGERRTDGPDRIRSIYVGPRLSATAASADIRIIIPPGSEPEVARMLISGSSTDARRLGVDPKLISAASALLRTGPVVSLPGNTPSSARAAGILDTAMGSTAASGAHALTNAASWTEMHALLDAMRAGEVDLLIVCAANPAYSLAAAAEFEDALRRVKTVVSLSSYADETSRMARWVLPSNTPLESWGDYQPYSDVFNLMQPATSRVQDTRETGDILIGLARRVDETLANRLGAANWYDYLRRRWGVPVADGDRPSTPQPQWEALLQRGGQWPGAADEQATPDAGYTSLAPIPSIEKTTATAALRPPSAISPRPAGLPPAVQEASAGERELSLYAYPHIFLYDGRGANRSWLQEIAEPVTLGVWESWAEMHPETMRELGVNTDDIVRITAGGQSARLPVRAYSGVARGTVAVPLGQGHTAYGRYASGSGANVFALLGPEVTFARVEPAGEKSWAARIRAASSQHDRHLAQTVELGHEPDTDEHRELTMPLPSGYSWEDFQPGHSHGDYRWAMTVDLDKCTGCGACVAACYAENNLPTVGRDAIWRGREMYWIRVDRYIDSADEAAPVVFQPMMCQQCDAAPCETVCPVYASVHSTSGINEQVYNRCVGTRYCSNNCPYKVRRFNWRRHEWPEPLNWQLNPDVTVRCRGVMEKCTFCIQRIRQATMTAKREGRSIRDGEVVPACVATCPTGVFTFGNLKDPESRVARIVREDPRAYQVLHELNTKPGVIYLKRVVERT